MKRVVSALVVSLFVATLASAQDFFEVVRTGTPVQVRAAIAAGAKINPLPRTLGVRTTPGFDRYSLQICRLLDVT